MTQGKFDSHDGIMYIPQGKSNAAQGESNVTQGKFDLRDGIMYIPQKKSNAVHEEFDFPLRNVLYRF